MEEMVKDDVSGYFKRFLISLMTGGRSNEPGNPQKAVHLARELYNAGEGRIGTNEGKIKLFIISNKYILMYRIINFM